MRYLIKEFGANEHYGYALHLATDEGDETTRGSLWWWLWHAKRRGDEISIHRMLSGAHGSAATDEVLMIDADGEMTLGFAFDAMHLSETDPSIQAYQLECVLDLS